MSTIVTKIGYKTNFPRFYQIPIRLPFKMCRDRSEDRVCRSYLAMPHASDQRAGRPGPVLGRFCRNLLFLAASTLHTAAVTTTRSTFKIEGPSRVPWRVEFWGPDEGFGLEGIPEVKIQRGHSSQKRKPYMWAASYGRRSA